MSKLADKARELQRVSTFTFEQAVAALDAHPDLDVTDAVAVAQLVSGPDDGTPEYHTRLSEAVEYFLNITATDPPAEPIVIDGATWAENTGFWQDGVQSWRLQSPTWTADIRRGGPSSFGWTVRSEAARGDRGIAPTLAWAQEHAATWVRNHGEAHLTSEETK
jgi:hypothetical protein